MQKKSLLNIICLLAFMGLQAQSMEANRPKPVAISPTNTKTIAAACNQPFPACLVGHWKGQLQWMVNGKPVRTFMMQLKVQPTDSAGTYSWQIIYGEGGQDNRPYLLKPVDTAKGRWAIDERNGIVLDSYVWGNTLQSMFTVQGNTILGNYRLEEGKLQVEFFTILLAGKATNEQPISESEAPPTVTNHQIASYQQGVLTRDQ